MDLNETPSPLTESNQSNDASTAFELPPTQSVASDYTPERITKLLTRLVVEILPEKSPDQIITLLGGHVRDVVETEFDSFSPAPGTPLTRVEKANMDAEVDAVSVKASPRHPREEKEV